ncbi:inositol 1,4,5-trisphosphate receptor-interacting protein-like 1 [Cuculus canorus]|uniref:inositol 1,4,5-trisphosphate receptor-interacting protein-like 1 n=1 Tax=Cuculus canorus TaxID=55661 RepID=UPI0023AB1161|nr:inositol 1,4,5-trisphosphate receptor-interacting protein-like 1 [Cuculus canorus]
MAAPAFLVRVLLAMVQNVPMVGGELDEATRERMHQRAVYLERETTRLLQDIEQMSQEQSGFVWEALLFSALRDWQFWLTACELIVIFGLQWWFRERSHEADSSNEENSLEDTKAEERENYYEDVNDLEGISEAHIQCLVQDMAREHMEAEDLLFGFITTIKQLLSNSFFPELQRPIGVGSAFEGWGPCVGDSVYHFLLPLKAPHEYTFHLEPDTAGEVPARNFRIRVELLCTCTTEQQAEKMRCFLHQPEEEQRGNQDLHTLCTFLHTLCTGSYLDVQKTASWFKENLKAVWKDLPQSAQSRLTMLPSSRSCKFQVTKDNQEIFIVDVAFGLQQGDSDIFLSSQATEATFMPSTTWPESYEVAEVKFFGHMARQVPHNNFHIKCLQAGASILVGTGFSTYTLKTVVMHLLTIIPLSGQYKEDHVLLLMDAMQYLCYCLTEKRLNHFFFGNENMPKEIILPSHFQMAEPLNLFQHLAQDPDAHVRAWDEFVMLWDRLRSVLIYTSRKRSPCTVWE